MADFTRGIQVAEGKTKVLWAILKEPGNVDIESKDDITAGDGAKHDVLLGKAALANRTTCNVFHLLNACGVPTAFIEQTSATSFKARASRMLPLEVVVRREAHGSYLKRSPHLSKGHVFPRLLVEFFLKTSGKQWQGVTIPKDDPFIRFGQNEMLLYLPDKPVLSQEPFLVIDDFLSEGHGARIADQARRIFLILEKAWQLLGRRLVDFKIEFGIDQADNLVLADVIDNDSWRVVYEGQYEDKQVYRDGGGLDEVTLKYRRVADLTDRFGLPKQRVIVWYGSPGDDQGPMTKAFEKLGIPVELVHHVRSAHKAPAAAYLDIQRLVQEVPDCVVIAEIGRSNGAGPMLAANIMAPVISRPSTWKERPEDVWSSLHVPSDDPNLTVLDPGNAALAALKLLARNHSGIYADLRLKMEERQTNVVEIV